MKGDVHVEPEEAGLKKQDGAGRDSATTESHGWQKFSNGDTKCRDSQPAKNDQKQSITARRSRQRELIRASGVLPKAAANVYSGGSHDHVVYRKKSRWSRAGGKNRKMFVGRRAVGASQ
jgi:hypothetical protein